MPSHGPSFGLATGFFLRDPGGAENSSMFRILSRDSPNSRAACRLLILSTCTARRTRAYTSTLYTSQFRRTPQPQLQERQTDVGSPAVTPARRLGNVQTFAPSGFVE